MERRLQKPRKEKACGLNDWRKGVEVSETKRSLAEVKEGRKEPRDASSLVLSRSAFVCICPSCRFLFLFPFLFVRFRRRKEGSKEGRERNKGGPTVGAGRQAGRQAGWLAGLGWGREGEGLDPNFKVPKRGRIKRLIGPGKT